MSVQVWQEVNRLSLWLELWLEGRGPEAVQTLPAFSHTPSVHTRSIAGGAEAPWWMASL